MRKFVAIVDMILYFHSLTSSSRFFLVRHFHAPSHFPSTHPRRCSNRNIQYCPAKKRKTIRNEPGMPTTISRIVITGSVTKPQRSKTIPITRCGMKKILHKTSRPCESLVIAVTISSYSSAWTYSVYIVGDSVDIQTQLRAQNCGKRPCSIGRSMAAMTPLTNPSMMSPGVDASAAGRLA